MQCGYTGSLKKVQRHRVGVDEQSGGVIRAKSFEVDDLVASAKRSVVVTCLYCGIATGAEGSTG